MKFSLLPRLAVILSSAFAASAFAGPIPYPNVGQVVPVATLTANATGAVTGYFVGSETSDVDQIRLVDETSGTISPYFFVSNATAPGATANFGSVMQGDVLAFEINNVTLGSVFSSDPSRSPDGINHAYATTFNGGTLNGVTFAGGQYAFFGMEDLPKSISDLDYNDEQFLVSLTGVGATPEPSSLLLLGTGLLGVLGTQRRRFGF